MTPNPETVKHCRRCGSVKIGKRCHTCEASHMREKRLYYTPEESEHDRQNHLKWKLEHPQQYKLTNARGKLRRRSREKNFIFEEIDLEVLAIRDNWICHICGKKVTRKNWSRDHLIPVIYGGHHTWDNIALAHRRCNSLRGAGKLPAQLRLFGLPPELAS